MSFAAPGRAQPNAPSLEVKNLGSAEFELNDISVGGGLVKNATNCTNRVAAGVSCYLTVSDPSNQSIGGTVTLTTNLNPPVQTFATPINMDPLGNGFSNDPVFEDTVVSFPPQFAGTSTGTVPLRVWNLSYHNAAVTKVQGSSGVEQTSDCGLLIPNAMCTIQV